MLTARSAPLVVGLAVGLLIGFLAGLAMRPATDRQTAVPGASAATVRPPPDRTAAGIPSGLRSVSLASLPREAASTVAAIDAGGPFAYRQDGAIFENRERLLPDRPTGYYREFTVPTPGVSGRGPRRIVAGANGEMYWTSDHYDSFAWIVR